MFVNNTQRGDREERAWQQPRAKEVKAVVTEWGLGADAGHSNI